MNEIIDNKSQVFPFLIGDSEKISYYGYTCIGGRAEDQDCLAYRDVNERQIFAVCDGMGGHAGGCVASATAVQALTDSFGRQAKIVSTKETIITAVNEANTAVYKKAQDNPSLRGMGTTLTLLVIDDEAAYVTHIGDSRVYQLRNGRKIFRTFDHSMVFEQVAKGFSWKNKFRRNVLGKKDAYLTEEEARVHPRSNILSRAVGILADVEFVVTKLSYKKNDRFILCCDGVWNTQPEIDIISMFTVNSDLKTTILSTQAIVEKIGKENGGMHDNHTMIAVDMKSNSKYRKTICSRLNNLFRRSV